MIGSALARGPDAIRGMIGATLNGTLQWLLRDRQASLEDRRTCPDFGPPDLVGKTSQALGLSRQPNVGPFLATELRFHAQRMLPDLKAWEANLVSTVRRSRSWFQPIASRTTRRWACARRSCSRKLVMSVGSKFEQRLARRWPCWLTLRARSLLN